MEIEYEMSEIILEALQTMEASNEEIEDFKKRT